MTRQFIVFRKAHAALRLGDIPFIDAPEPILAFQRTDPQGGDALLCLFNLGGEEAHFALPEGDWADCRYGLMGRMEGKQAALPPWGGLVLCRNA